MLLSPPPRPVPTSAAALVILLLLLVAHLPAETLASCNIGARSSCDAANFTATIDIFFVVHPNESNGEFETYDAAVIFRWGPENVTVGSRPYRIGDANGVSDTFRYETEGTYRAGYTFAFGDDAAAGCSGKTFEKTWSLSMERTPTSRRCVWVEEALAPAESPGSSPAQIGPTNAPVAAADDGSTGGDGGKGGAAAAASCSVDYRPACNPVDVTATSNLSFKVNPAESNGGFETYAATIIFHWGSESTTVGARPYKIGEPIELSDTIQYEGGGNYLVGYTLVFGDDAAAAGCSGRTFDKFYTLEMTPPGRCVWAGEAAPPTTSPIARPAESSGPTRSPAASVEAAEATPPTASLSGTSSQIGGGGVGPTATDLPAISSGPGCSVSYSYSCSVSVDNSTATSTVSFRVDRVESNRDFETYDAAVTFHWGAEDYVATGSRSYKIGDPIVLSDTFRYEADGEYDVGYMLAFGDDAAASCSGRTYDASVALNVEVGPLSRNCFFGAEAPSPAVGSPAAPTNPANLFAPEMVEPTGNGESSGDYPATGSMSAPGAAGEDSDGGNGNAGATGPADSISPGNDVPAIDESPGLVDLESNGVSSNGALKPIYCAIVLVSAVWRLMFR